ncbi:hypothetical protein MFIFM68171_04520 [Madurella fahalii]|uniref:Uncharacterized protein n=1 Tax=Madurella fahalii TaxID=1157608 RepID=A0ABQ0G9P8_9PEZI
MASYLRLIKSVVAALCVFTPAAAYTQKPSIFTFSPNDPRFQLGAPGLAPEIKVANNDLPGVKRVASHLAADFGRMLGVNGTVVVADWDSTIPQRRNKKPIILIGTVGRSSLVDSLAASKKLDITTLANKWRIFHTGL